MWTLILVIHGCCSAGGAGTAMTSVVGLPTEEACRATGKAIDEADENRLIWHCAKVVGAPPPPSRRHRS